MGVRKLELNTERGTGAEDEILIFIDCYTFTGVRARFEFRNSAFSIPYPVPFKLLGDEAKG